MPNADRPAACKHESCSFDRSICACGSMHDYCDECGAAMDCPLDKEPQEQSAAKRQEWETRQLMIGYPTSENDWTPIASPAHLIRGKDVLEHAQRHFDARGEHYLLVRIHLGDTRVTSRPVLDDETMADLPVTGNVVSMRLVRLLV